MSRRSSPAFGLGASALEPDAISDAAELVIAAFRPELDSGASLRPHQFQALLALEAALLNIRRPLPIERPAASRASRDLSESPRSRPWPPASGAHPRLAAVSTQRAPA